MDNDIFEIEEFLRKRGIEENTLALIKNEKIDSHVVQLMSDEVLSKYLSAYGDRLALKQFCNKKLKTEVPSKKLTILERLRKKVSSKYYCSSSDEEKEPKLKKKKWGNEKKTRQVEIGWMCSINGDKYVQIKTKYGGGTRKVQMAKTAKKSDLIKKGIELFFPNGQSTKGNLEKFSLNLLDFKGHSVEEDISVEEMLEKTSLTRLRVYLASKEATSTRVSNSEEPIASELELANNDVPHNLQLENFDSTDMNYLNEDFVPLPHLEFDYESHQSQSFDTQVSEQSEQINVQITLLLHRGQVFEELITAFLNIDNKDAFINIKMILPNGVEETGQDLGGVFRDALSEFWGTFNEKCTIGTTYKVPYVRHDFNNEKWQAIAAILYKGYVETNYFPIDLAPVFLEMCITGKLHSSLKDSFFGFISEQEKTVLQHSIVDFHEVENEDLLDVLSNLECKVIPSKANISQLIEDLAHKELIQKPKYVIDCWHEVLNNMITNTELTQLYIDKKVTSKTVISILTPKSEPLSADEQNIFNFLKKFIRESDTKILKQFLRFCTGADVLTNNKITVTFNNKNGLMKLPTASTCVCNLDLSINYDNFPEFRSEWNAVLQSNIWVMDFV